MSPYSDDGDYGADPFFGHRTSDDIGLKGLTVTGFISLWAGTQRFRSDPSPAASVKSISFIGRSLTAATSTRTPSRSTPAA